MRGHSEYPARVRAAHPRDFVRGQDQRVPQRALGNWMPPVAVAPAPPANPDGSSAHARALEYRKKAARLRHIHSLKLTRYI